MYTPDPIIKEEEVINDPVYIFTNTDEGAECEREMKDIDNDWHPNETI